MSNLPRPDQWTRPTPRDAGDLARASGQSTETLPADLAEASPAAIRPRLEDVDRAELSLFGAPREAVAGAPAIDQLTAFLGRPV